MSTSQFSFSSPRDGLLRDGLSHRTARGNPAAFGFTIASCVLAFAIGCSSDGDATSEAAMSVNANTDACDFDHQVVSLPNDAFASVQASLADHAGLLDATWANDE